MALNRWLLLLIVLLERAAFYGAAVSLPNFLAAKMGQAGLTFTLNGLFVGTFVLPWLLERTISSRLSRPAALQVGLALLAMGIHSLPFGWYGLGLGLVSLALSAAFIKPSLGSTADLWPTPVSGAVFQAIAVDLGAALGPLLCLAIGQPDARAPRATAATFFVAVLIASGAFFTSILLPSEANPALRRDVNADRAYRGGFARVAWIFVALVPFCAALQQGNSAALQHADTHPFLAFGRSWGSDGAFLVFGLTAAVIAATCYRTICRWPSQCFWLGVSIVGFAFVAFSSGRVAGADVLLWLALGLGESLALPAASGLFVQSAPDFASRRSFQALFVLANGLGTSLAFVLSGLYGSKAGVHYFGLFGFLCLAVASCAILLAVIREAMSWVRH